MTDRANAMHLYHRWSSVPGQMLRMVLSAKDLQWEDHPCALQDQETAFDLGYGDLPVLVHGDGHKQQGTLPELAELDQRYPETPPLLESLGEAEWTAFCQWRSSLTPLLERLIAPVLPAYAEISHHEEDMAFYRNECERRFQQSIEALANDRYGAYQQLESRGRLRELGRILARQRFYTGHLSLIDIVLTADLHLLRLLDGVTIPLDLQYYFQRVADACQLSLNDGMSQSL
ncbi:glutathione S-transferase N-terminal domain-containing protein [Acidithiobacillus sp. M4-SHS-6]|uniref:glutathione S-transferase N-terminal domain-containing protein n=1 Tax=Acidithiobacillus sp. M4-SHS-6 TaxID=3383024 RepID=UPI0039BE7664